MAADSSSPPSSGGAEAKTTGAQPTVEPQNPPHKRLAEQQHHHHGLETKQSDDGNSQDGAAEKLAFEGPVEVDADLEPEDDPEINQIPPEVRRVVSLHDDSMCLSHLCLCIISFIPPKK